MFEFSDVMWRMVVAFIIGAVVGLERESHITDRRVKGEENQKNSAITGVRTFALISGLGGLSGLLWPQHPVPVVFISLVVALLLVVYYILSSRQSNDTGITTEVAGVFVYVLGYMALVEGFPVQAIVAMTVILTFFLSRKREIKSLSWGIERREFNASVSYSLIALVILPFLPNQGYALADIPGFIAFAEGMGWNLGAISGVELLNPFRLWLIVALITGLDLAGYILEHAIGHKRGRLVTSMVGGFISSTATTQALAQESNTNPRVNNLVMAAVVSNLVSFLQMFVLLISLNAAFAAEVLPVLLWMSVAAFVAIGYFGWLRPASSGKNPPGMASEIRERKLFAMGPAIKFALVFIFIRFASQVALELLGNAGFQFTNALSGLTSTDVGTINTAVLVNEERISVQMGLMAFVLLNAVNLGAKTVYSYAQGTRAFALKFGLSGLLIILGALVGAFLV